MGVRQAVGRRRRARGQWSLFALLIEVSALCLYFAMFRWSPMAGAWLSALGAPVLTIFFWRRVMRGDRVIAAMLGIGTASVTCAATFGMAAALTLLAPPPGASSRFGDGWQAVYEGIGTGVFVGIACGCGVAIAYDWHCLARAVRLRRRPRFGGQRTYGATRSEATTGGAATGGNFPCAGAENLLAGGETGAESASWHWPQFTLREIFAVTALVAALLGAASLQTDREALPGTLAGGMVLIGGLILWRAVRQNEPWFAIGRSADLPAGPQARVPTLAKPSEDSPQLPSASRDSPRSRQHRLIGTVDREKETTSPKSP